MLRTRSFEDAANPLLSVLVPLKEIEFQLNPHLLLTTLHVRRDKVGGYIWSTQGSIISAESAPAKILRTRINELYNAIINPDLLDALDALPEETKREGWYKVYRRCAEEVYFGGIRHLHPEDLEEVLYTYTVEFHIHLHNATMPTPESLNV